MKILILSNKMPYPLKDGGAIATYMIAEGLSKLNNCISIMAMNTSKHFTDINRVQREIKTVASISAIKINTRLNLLKVLVNLFCSRLPYNLERFRSDEFKKQLTSIISREHFDIIQIESIYLGPYIPIIKKITSARIVLRPHNLEQEIWKSLSRNEKQPIKKLYLKILSERIKKFEQHIINQYDLLVPISETDAQKFASLGNKKPLHVTPVGVNIQRTSFKNGNTIPTSLFYIGALDWMPNQEGMSWFLNEIWPVVTKKHPKLKLYIAGRNPPDWLVKRCNEKKIEFKGEVESSSKFMEGKSIMIVPLKSGSGIRVKIIEAMSKGKVIISTSTGAHGIPCKHGENIIIADSPVHFISAIGELTSNYSLFNRISKNAVTFINENFDNTKLCASLNEFYNKQAIPNPNKPKPIDIAKKDI